MAKLPNPVDYAVPFFILLIVIEMVWARRNAPEKYEPRDTLLSLTFGLGSTVVGLLVGAAIYGLMMQVYTIRPITVPWTWWAWIACFVLDDLLYYLFHRTAHRVRWFWASHVNHHSSQHYNLSTALRQTWTGWLALSFVFKLPLAALGFHPAMILFCVGLNLIYQFWIHTEAIKRFPRWFEAVMNTPSHHRVHHATNPRYLDANYAGVFIVWDRMFGTFVAETDEEPIRYGIVRQLGTFNLLYAVFHEWIGIARDVWSA
ncbi:MAG: sterol desaturase family protein, partial [Brevundimonas sp.]|nr:sterol desaturase family protein [Brevundimonas sp.]